MPICCRLLLFFGLAITLSAQTPPQCRVELFIGDPEFSTGDGGPALNAKFTGPGAIAAADDGTIYVADVYGYRIRKIDPQGSITTVAGTGLRGTSGDGGPAIQAQVVGPSYLKLAPDGALYFVDNGLRMLRKITPTGQMETVYSQSSGSINGVLVANGSVYFTGTGQFGDGSSDSVSGVFRLDGNGLKTLIAGGVSCCGNGTADGVSALEYRFESPGELLAASNGELVVRDRDRIMRIGNDGIIRVIVGNGGGNFLDGAPALQTGLGFPNYLAGNPDGDLFIADGTWGLLVVRAGVIHRLAAGSPLGLTSSAAGVFFSREDRVFRLTPNDTIQPIAGVDRSAWYESGRPLNQSFVTGTRKMLTDSEDRLYFFGGNAIAVMRTTLDGRIEVVAGGGEQPADDGVPALNAALGLVADIALDGQDRLYMSVGARSTRPSMILRVEQNGTLTVLAGEGDFGQPEFFANQKALDVNFAGRAPLIAVSPNGKLTFQIRSRGFEVDANGILKSAPPGQASFTAFDREGKLLAANTFLEVYENLDGPPLRPFSVSAVQGASASNGTLFALHGAIRLLRRTPEGRITDLLASWADFQFAQGKLAPNSGLVSATAITTNKEGDLFIADPGLRRVFVIRDADICSMERPFSADILNGARFTAALGTGGFAPGEIVSVFGDFLGGETLAYGVPGVSSQGTWQTSVGGLEVLVDGQPAPIIFSRADQAAFVIPNEVSGEMEIRFRRNGLDSPTFTHNVRNASPGIFTVNSSGGGQAAALNQDSSINSPSNRAAPGSVIVLYVTGAGLTNPPSQTGSLNSFPLPQLVEPVQVSINFADAVVEFAGPAPGLISGVVQINARIPAETPSGTDIPVVVKIGGVELRQSPSSQWPTISIQ